MARGTADDIMSYVEMCQREKTSSLQRGMNFRLGPDYSVLLMSTRPNAPYRDRIEEGGAILIYEGHDEVRHPGQKDPKEVNQPLFTQVGSLTENGKFYQAALRHKLQGAPPERVRVYEKVRPSIWVYNGLFHLVDAWIESDGQRDVVKFKLVAMPDAQPNEEAVNTEPERRRIIPASVKLEVWKRDKGRCVVCGSTDELHFDHVIPYSRGGTSLSADNIQLLCMRHNLEKSNRIE